jgi:hypothetical protein
MLRLQFSSLSEAADQYYFSRRRAAQLRAEYGALKQSYHVRSTSRMLLLGPLNRIDFDLTVRSALNALAIFF